MRVARELIKKLGRGSVESNTLIALAPVLVLISLFNAYAVASHIFQTSDSVQGLLTGDSVVKGNLLLSGWHLATDNFLFTDTLPFAAFELFLGPRADLLVLIPALTYALIVLVALSMSIRLRGSAERNLATLSVVALALAMPPRIGDWNPVLMSNFHLGAILGALVALTICVRLS